MAIFQKQHKINMGKYIDVEKLKAEIERLNSLVSYESKDRHDEGLHDAYKAVKNVIASLQQEQLEVDLEKEIDDYLEPIKAWQIQEAPFTSMENCARHFAKWGRKQVLQEIYDGKVKPVDKITAAWIDDESKAKEE